MMKLLYSITEVVTNISEVFAYRDGSIYGLEISGYKNAFQFILCYQVAFCESSFMSKLLLGNLPLEH